MVFYWAACVGKHRCKEVADFVGLDCSIITTIASLYSEAKNTET